MFILISILFALAFLIFFSIWITKQSSGDKKMQEVSNIIRRGSLMFLKSEYKILTIFILAISTILLLFNYKLSIMFFLGSLFSLIIGNVGIRIATKANVKTAEAAKKSLQKGLRTAFYSGLAASTIAMLFGVLGIIFLYSYFKEIQIFYGFVFGASFVALFMRVGGGIFTKSADISADLTGKIEKNLPEDSPRNPAVISDLVGDNVGDVAGMSSDLFESYIGCIIATMVIASSLAIDILTPLKIASIGIIASIFSVIIIKGKNIYNAIIRCFILASLIIAIVSFFFLKSYFYPILLGLVAGLVVGMSVLYYTSASKKPSIKIATAARRGAALNVLRGISNGMISTIIPVLVIAIIIILSYKFSGIYGIAISAVSMLSILGVTLGATIYGSITDNASGISEFCNLKSRKNTEKLDEVGNTTAAIGKGFTISSAALTVLTLLASFVVITKIDVLDILNVENMAALFIGAALPFLFSAITINAVDSTSQKLIDEVRKQFKDKKILTGKKKPDYNKCIEITTNNSIKKMIVPSIIIILITIIIGLVLGKTALASLIVGSVAASFLLAIFMTNAGGSLDNAKKYVEAGNFGGKGSETHKATVIGDTVGDPLKDTAGPSLNILIKLIAITALVFVLVS